MEHEPMSPPFGFTPEQWDRYQRLVPDVPEEAVAALIREFGCADQKEDLLQEAYLGTAKGVLTHDETKGSPLRTWVFFSALHAAQAILRRKKRQSRVGQRMWEALTVYCKHEHRTFGVMGEVVVDRESLTEFRSAAAAAPYVGVAVLDVQAGGEDELVERETAMRCAAGLKKALGELSERPSELLRLCFAETQSVKDAASARGERGYRAELLEFHRAVGLVGARMRGMGFHELPPFPPEAGGTILRVSPDGPVKR